MSIAHPPSIAPPVVGVTPKAGEKPLFLTIDLCAHGTHANDFEKNLFDAINEAKVPVTVFVSGEWARDHQKKFVELINNPLVTIGNHVDAWNRWCLAPRGWLRCSGQHVFLSGTVGSGYARRNGCGSAAGHDHC